MQPINFFVYLVFTNLCSIDCTIYPFISIVQETIVNIYAAINGVTDEGDTQTFMRRLQASCTCGGD